MNPIKRDNLEEILKLGYPNICLSTYDIKVIENSTSLKKNFYPIYKGYAKIGFYNAKTLVWNGWQLESGQIKIALRPQKSPESDTWSEIMSFRDEGDALKIYKHMKFKIFW